MAATQIQHPITDHLWQLGFTIKAKADRMLVPLPMPDGSTLVTHFEIEALPERGEARRLFSRKGASRAEIKTNVPLEALLAEHEHGDSGLQDIYIEKCAAILLEMLTATEPTLRQPRIPNGGAPQP
jgi:hypothetical protein